MTEAGKRLLAILDIQARHVGLPPELTQDFPSRIAAIEAEAARDCAAHQAEAVAAERARIKAGVEGLEFEFEDVRPSRFLVVRAAVLRIIEEGS